VVSVFFLQQRVKRFVDIRQSQKFFNSANESNSNHIEFHLLTLMTAQTKVLPSSEVHPPSREQAMEKRHLKVCEPEKQVRHGFF
jgi:hypothetical protein